MDTLLAIGMPGGIEVLIVSTLSLACPLLLLYVMVRVWRGHTSRLDQRLRRIEEQLAQLTEKDR